MKKTYIAPSMENVEVDGVQMLGESPVGVIGPEGTGYGGVDDGTRDASSRQYWQWDEDEEEEADEY